MGKMNISLPDDLETKFRKAVYEKKGMKKGNISESLEEAIEAWVKDENKKKPNKGEIL